MKNKKNTPIPYEKMSKKARKQLDRSHRIITGMNTGTRDMDLPYKQRKQESCAEAEEKEYEEKGAPYGENREKNEDVHH